MSSIFCCHAARTDSPPIPNSSSYQLPRPSSSLSVTYVDDNSLHPAVPGTIGDAEALQEIFASLSPVRGYQAVSRTPSDLRGCDPEHLSPPPLRLSHHPLSALTRTARKRLSGSVLSYQSSKKFGPPGEKHELVHYDVVRSASRGPDMGDILASRTVSKGGYDPDALGIKTPSEQQPSAGSVQVSPQYLTKVLRSLEASPKRSESCSSKSAHALTRHIMDHNDTRDTSGDDGDDVDDDFDSNIRFGDRRLQAQSSPTPDPETPHRQSFSAALEFGSQESPRETIQRLHDSIGKTHLAKSAGPPILTTDASNTARAQGSWRLSFSAPIRGSSLGKNTGHQRTPLYPATDNIPRSPGDSSSLFRPDGTNVMHKHSSVFSENDDSLLGAIGAYLNQQSPSRVRQQGSGENEKSIERSGLLAVQQNPGFPVVGSTLKERRSSTSKATTGGRQSSFRGTPQQQSKDHLSSDSERPSIHLFNMHISQRLASNSGVDVISPSLSRAESISVKSSTGNNSRLKLSSNDGPSSAHANYPNKQSLVTSRAAPVDDDRPVTPRNFTDDCIPDFRRHSSMGNLTTKNADPEFRRNTTEMMRSTTDTFRPQGSNPRFGDDNLGRVVVPKASKFVENFASQKGKDESLHVSNHTNISPQLGYPRLNSRLSQDRHSQGSSQAYHGRAVGGDSKRLSDGWLTGGRRQGYGYEFVESTDEEVTPNDADNHDSQDGMNSYESAASVWERALRAARDTRPPEILRSSFDSPLQVPHFQREAEGGGHQVDQKHGQQPLFTKNGLLSATTPLRYRDSKKSTGQGSSMEIMDSIYAGSTKSPMSRSMNQSFSSTKPKRSEGSIFRRYAGLGFSRAATARAPNWTRFPSHTRSQRSGSAGESDMIQVRDFSPITEASMSSVADHSTITSTTPPLPSSLVMKRNKPRLLADRKSKSMTFGKDTAKRVWNHWVRIYRSQSSDLRRFRTGHRSSISQGVGKVEYPELEIIPGFFGTTKSALEVDGSLDVSSEDQALQFQDHEDFDKEILCAVPSDPRLQVKDREASDHENLFESTRSINHLASSAAGPSYHHSPPSRREANNLQINTPQRAPSAILASSPSRYFTAPSCNRPSSHSLPMAADKTSPESAVEQRQHRVTNKGKERLKTSNEDSYVDLSVHSLPTPSDIGLQLEFTSERPSMRERQVQVQDRQDMAHGNDRNREDAAAGADSGTGERGEYHYQERFQHRYLGVRDGVETGRAQTQAKGRETERDDGGMKDVYGYGFGVHT